jgi:hypothetical protein
VKGKIFSGVLAVIGAFALSTTGAEAGAGGNPVPLTSFYVCQGLAGSGPENQVFDIEVLGVKLLSVQIGNASLACVFAKLFNPVTGTEIDPNPVPGNREDLKCYAIANSGKSDTPPQGIPLRFNAVGAFGTEEDLQVTGIRYLCSPATFTLSP